MIRNKIAHLAIFSIGIVSQVNAASSVIVSNVGCAKDAIYTTVASSNPIVINGDGFSAPSLIAESGTIKSGSTKQINLTRPNSKVKTQIIFIDHYEKNKKVTTQLWLTHNKLCQVIDQQSFCYIFDYKLFDKAVPASIQLCAINKPLKSGASSSAKTVSGSALESYR